MDVGDWLRSLGLERHGPAFRDNSIDADVLPDLTDGDLEKLGVNLGDRKRLLRAIAALAASGHQPSPTSRAPAADAAERRQLTVMFCDLVGSTAMSARLDPEDMREVIRAYQDACSGAVARYDGFVAKFMGDGVLAYFGFPRAHEDDAERAVRAGLDIVSGAPKLETPAKAALRVRIGIATGIVVVGDVVGRGSAQEQAVVGDTPNLAARLQALAEPGSVLVAEATRRLLGGTFELTPLGPQALKGFDAPVAAWAVIREAENVSRFEASRSAGMTPFVGREHEVSLLLDRWREATGGEGQVALLSGEADIGKSRILEALSERIGDEPHTTVRYQCSPHQVNDAFYPMTSHIWRAAGFVSDEPPVARLDKLEALIGRSRLDAREIAHFLAALLSIPFEGRYPPLEMAPSEQKERTITALIAVFSGLTKQAPVLALLEDAHWIDPTALDLFGRLVDRLADLRALLVLTYRPEFVAPWVGRANVATLSLSRFGRRQAVAMVDCVTGGKPLPAEVLEQIVAKTDGVPLFVEELTKTVLESGLLREEDGSFVLDRALTPLAIPSTLQDSLMARLDRLATVKEIAQIGATIGREFSYRLLEAVSPIKGAALQDALGQLIAAELIHGRGTPPEAIYIFKHALVQDTAYASLLRSGRQRIHADLARALKDRFADQIGAAPAIIAHHYTEAGLYEPASHCWLDASKLALSRSSQTEAGRYIDAGLGLIPHLTAGMDRQSLELAFQLARASALFSLKGYSSKETVAALIEAQHLLVEGVGTDAQRFAVLAGLWVAENTAARLDSAQSLSCQMLEIAERQNKATYWLAAYRHHDFTLIHRGRHREGLESFQRAERYRGPDPNKRLSYRFADDPNLAVQCYKISALMALGRVDEAADASDQVRNEAAEHDHFPTVALCVLCATVFPQYLLGDFEACERHSAELVAYSNEKKLEQYRLFGLLFHACARAGRDPAAEHIEAIRTALDIYNRSGAGIMGSLFLSQLADSLLRAGDVTGSERALREAFAFVEQSDERFWLADLHRVEGQIALQRPEPNRERAEACFLQAVEIAHGQEARMLELRAATDLARLWRDTGSPNDPRAPLEPILAAIEGGESTRDVRAARALLAEMG
jgi:class 3 adenylate cyclase/tetratricopeptide (TPR) repeat protein